MDPGNNYYVMTKETHYLKYKQFQQYIKIILNCTEVRLKYITFKGENEHSAKKKTKNKYLA